MLPLVDEGGELDFLSPIVNGFGGLAVYGTGGLLALRVAYLALEILGYDVSDAKLVQVIPARLFVYSVVASLTIACVLYRGLQKLLENILIEA